MKMMLLRLNMMAETSSCIFFVETLFAFRGLNLVRRVINLILNCRHVTGRRELAEESIRNVGQSLIQIRKLANYSCYVLLNQ